MINALISFGLCCFIYGVLSGIVIGLLIAFMINVITESEDA